MSYRIPVVTSAMDAVRAFAEGQPVGVPEDVAMTLTNWGFHMTPAKSVPGLPLITKQKAKHAADILSEVDYDHSVNSQDPVMVQADDQPGISVPDLTVLLIGPGRGVPGDGVLAVVARMNPDGTPAYVNPLGVPGVVDLPTFAPVPTPPGTVGLAGFGQIVPGVPATQAVIASIPLPTAISSQGEFNVTAGHILSFTGSAAGQVLGKIPFVGSGISIAQAGAELSMGEGTAHQWINFFVQVAQGGGGIAGTAARVAIPGLGTLQVISDFTSGDSRSIAQGIATLVTAPLSIMFGPAGSAAQQAARWITGKVYDYFAAREADAAAEAAGLATGLGLAPGEIAGEQALMASYAAQKAVDQGLLQAVQLQSAQDLTTQVFGDLAVQQAQQTQDIQAIAESMASQDGVLPLPETVAAATGLDVGTVADAMGVPVTPPDAIMDVTLTPAVEPVPTEVTDITGQPVLPPLDTMTEPLTAPATPLDEIVPVDTTVDTTGTPTTPEAEVTPVTVAPTPAPAPYTGPVWPGPGVAVAIPCSWNPSLTCTVYFGEAEFYAYVQGGGTFRG